MSLIDDLMRRKADLSPAQRALLEKWKRGETAPPAEPSAIPRRGAASAPLSFTQQRLWFLDKLAPGAGAYSIPVALRLGGALDVEALQRALDAIVARHEILRTTFSDADQQLTQIIAPSQPAPLTVIDLSAEDQPEQAALRRLTLEVQRPFDLLRGPLVRATLLRLADQDHIALLDLHHIVGDGRSKGVLTHELAVFYAAYAQGRPIDLPELPIQYADYAAWQRQTLQGEALEQQLSYWRKQLANLPVLNLPSDRPRPPIQTFRGALHILSYPQALSAALTRLSQHEGATLFMVLLAAFQALLARYTDQTDIVVGSPIAGRNRPETQLLVGPFINTLVLRTDLGGNPGFRELLGRVRAVCSAAYAHQDLPFERLVEDLQPDRDLSRNPLFDVMLNLQNAPAADRQFDELTLQSLDIETGASQLDLTLFLVNTEGGLVGSIEYNTDLFDPTTIARLAERFQLILASVAENPDLQLADLPLLTDAEREQALVTWNATAADYPRDACIHSQFEAQAAQTPDAVALIAGDERLTYAELNRRANQLARCLQTLGVKPETPVGLCIDRSLELVVGMLGILKAGGAYLPLDPSYPAERLALMLQDSGAPVVLTQRHTSAVIERIGGAFTTVDLDADWPRIAEERDTNMADVVTPDNLAYVIYTSGSTGRPKGVMIGHRNAVNFFTGMDQQLGHESPGVWLAVTSVSFDISVLELLWTLTRGFQVVIHADQRRSARSAQPALDFSLFYFAGDAGDDASARYRLLLEGARYADRAGFNAIWTPERHFHPFGGLYPNPSVISAAIAAVTERIQIRAGSVVLPLHQPIRVAEEWAVVDNLSNGRVGLSVASGWHADDFVLAPDNYAERKAVMMEAIATVRALWRGERVTARGGSGQDVAVTIFPPPVQRDLPIWLTAAGNPETFQLAGASGANLLTHLLGQNLTELASKIALYRQAWREHGHGPGGGHVTLMLHTFVGEDLEQVRETVRRPFREYLRSSLDLIGNLARSMGQDINAASFSEADMDALLEYAFERYFSTSSLMGTPETCLEMIARLKEIGVDEVGCLIDFGVAPDLALKSLELLNVVRERSQQLVAPTAVALPLPDELTRHQVSHLQCTPSLARMLAQEPETLAALRSLRMLLLGGEALPPDLAAQLKAALPATIINMYGPTETTIWSATHVVDQVADTTPIGQPIANTQIYLLDRTLNLVPPGVPGELYIGGDGVARGYLGRPALTAERFIPNPFAKGRPLGQGGRMKDEDSQFSPHPSSFILYRTGDLARYRADGVIEFLGRVDHQLKLRGYRIELGEIEAVLRRHPLVHDAAVIAREDQAGDTRLAAYVVAGEPRTGNREQGNKGTNEQGNTTTDSDHRPLTTDHLRSFLAQRLPDYMIPSAFVLLDALPLTPNGKLDRNALPDPGRTTRTRQQAFVAPRTSAEQTLAEIWREVLRLERVGVHDNFFELGGDSILSLQVISQATRAGLRLTLTQFFQHQTIAALAGAAQASPAALADQDVLLGPAPLLPFQHWLLEQDLADAHYWNQVVLLKVFHTPRPEVLEEVVRRLLLHHDALRLRFTRDQYRWRQVFAAPGQPTPFSWVDLSAVPAEERAAALERAGIELQSSLDLAAGPLMRIAYVDLGPDEPGRLLMIIHHLVTDGVSWRIFLEDFQTLYQGVSQGLPVQLPPKTTSVRQWGERLTTYARSGELDDELSYWLDESRANVSLLPVDHPEGRRTSIVDSSYTERIWVDKQVTRTLVQQAPAAYQVQINDILMTALAWACRAWTGSPTLLTEMEGHGREALFEDLDPSRTVGWLASQFPLLLDVGAATTPIEALPMVKAQLRQIPRRGIGYGLLRYLGDERIVAQLRALPQAEIRFNYLGQFDQVLADDAPFGPSNDWVGRVRSPRGARRYLIEIDGSIVAGQFQLGWTYSRDLHHDATIARLIGYFVAALEALAAGCSAPER
jgi:natural product biosynthesis luciferase-like monooxygenase protein/non-ribosomal peptide synthase protein (TIGR01720 family)